MRVLGRYGEDHITFVSNARRWSVRCHGSHPVNSGMFWSLLSDIVAVVLVHHCDDVHTFLQNIKWAYLARHISYLFMITWCKITCLDQALRCCSSGICVGDRGCPAPKFCVKISRNDDTLRYMDNELPFMAPNQHNGHKIPSLLAHFVSLPGCFFGFCGRKRGTKPGPSKAQCVETQGCPLLPPLSPYVCRGIRGVGWLVMNVGHGAEWWKLGR